MNSMIRLSELSKEIYKPKDLAQFLGVTTKTLRNWDASGKIHFERDRLSDRRYMTKDVVVELLKENDLLIDDLSNKKRDVIYARVSSHDQKIHGDLDRQIQTIINANDDLQNVLILSEVGSGLNDKRKKLQQLLKMVMNNEVNRVFVTYKDRLTRFGFNYLETIFKLKNVDIIVLNHTDSELSDEQELVSDMMSLIASFSGKLYGLRSHKNKKLIKNELNKVQEKL